MRILGLDPGTTTGWAVIEKAPDLKTRYRILAMGECLAPDYDEFLINALVHNIVPTASSDSLFCPLDVVVVEDFIARPEFVRDKWTALPVAKQVGKVEILATYREIPVIVQQPRDKPAGYGFAFNGKIPFVKGKKGMHMNDAIAHAVFYLFNHWTSDERERTQL